MKKNSQKNNQKNSKFNNLLLIIAAVIAVLYYFLGPADTADKGSSAAANTPAAVTEISSQDSAAKQDEASQQSGAESSTDAQYIEYRFRNNKLLQQHYEKHGIEMGFADAESYEQAACDAANNPDALHKLEAEDGDDVYYVEATYEFVIISKDGYIRTYFLPNGGKSYFDRQ